MRNEQRRRRAAKRLALPATKEVSMRKYAFVITTALGLALAAGSAQAGGKLGVAGGDERSGAYGNGVQLNGIPASGFAVETVELPDGPVLAGSKLGISPDRSGNGIPASGFAVETVELPDGPVLAGGKLGMDPGRSGNGVQLNGIPASGLAVETVKLPDGTVIVQRRGDEKQCIQLGAMRPGPIPVMSGSRGYERQCVQLSAIPAIVRSRETMQPVDGTVSGVQLASYSRGGRLVTTGGRSGNGVHLNGIPASGFAVETVKLPDRSAQAGRQNGVDRNDIQLAEVRGSNLIRTSEGRWGNGVQLNGIPASGFAVETVKLPNEPVLAGSKLGIQPDRSGNGVQLNGISAGSFAVETVALPGGTVVVQRNGCESRAVRLDAISLCGFMVRKWRCRMP
jgi:hypothetical protein